jgi:hypothetical protein
MVQIAGIVAACAWTVVTASLVFGLLLIPRLWGSEWIFLSSFEKKHFVRLPPTELARPV